jgi:hypothetical protein
MQVVGRSVGPVVHPIRPPRFVVGFAGVITKLTVGSRMIVVVAIAEPAGLEATTVTVCDPEVGSEAAYGLVHALAAAVSTWQVTVLAGPPPRVKATCAVVAVWWPPAAGEVIATVGTGGSTFHVVVAVAGWLAGAPVAVTARV